MEMLAVVGILCDYIQKRAILQSLFFLMISVSGSTTKVIVHDIFRIDAEGV